MNDFPTRAEVEDAGATAILRWNRFLPSPRTHEELVVVKMIVDRLGNLDPGERVAASREVGW